MIVRESRIRALDSLRGLAAVTVVIAHACGILIEGHSFDEYTPLYLFRAAHESVIFFFLLSGYVLTYQILNQNVFNYKNFITLRIFRIYLPYLVIILLTLLVYALFQTTSPEMASVWGKPVTPEAIINHVILLGNFDTNAYNNVIWSLVHEIRVAVIFPIILYVISLEWRNAVLLTFVLSMLVAMAVVFGISHAEGYNNSYLYTVHYFSFFVLGALLIKYGSVISEWYLNLTGKQRTYILVFCLLVFCYSRMVFLIPHKFHLLKISLFGEFIADWLSALSAAFFIVAASQITNKKNLLLHPIPLFLGKISYSLYLIHLPVIIVFFNVFSGANRLVLIMVSIVVAFVLAFLSSKYLESSSARLGKWFVSNKLKYSKDPSRIE
ncbi:acyltransferase family protein [Dyadobacter luticola]|uniref:Acyltransferase n=1 Tax=Dyadobacter luticola TaxID=1979387 RepID=A0A5R9L571_9BACT|nr:acyltransferase [Dyadobacter luticola]TLV03716.1 acyltransferase [Dyadobacter luticola]